MSLTDNRLLNALPPDELDVMSPELVFHRLAFREGLYETDLPITAAFFPTLGVVSMVSGGDVGRIIEVATMGNEGMVGLPLFLGIDTSPMEAFVQVGGEGYRMDAGAFRKAALHLPGLREVMQRYTQAMFVQIAQNAACNGSHKILARCARWLLMTRDRMCSDEYVLTHEFLGQMLGVRRAGVSEVMSSLQNRGLLTYERGKVRILDVRGLEDASCACYGLIRREYERLLG